LLKPLATLLGNIHSMGFMFSDNECYEIELLLSEVVDMSDLFQALKEGVE